MDISSKSNFYLNILENHLSKLCDKLFNDTSQVGKASKYSLLNGGKRIRGIFTLSVCEMLTDDFNAVLDYASAVEMIHAYSLIHDDLPCMDNDDFRRGKPSCHKAFGEDIALLAGDALLTSAFNVLSENNQNTVINNLEAVKILSKSSGAKGMIYGQELDLYFENKKISKEQLQSIHKHKTGCLIDASITLGAVGAKKDEIEVLHQFAYDIGLVFQIVDDILDVTSTSELLGKPIGSDNANNKSTYTTLFGVEECKILSENITNNACEKLKLKFGDKSQFIVALANYLIDRKK